MKYYSQIFHKPLRCFAMLLNNYFPLRYIILFNIFFINSVASAQLIKGRVIDNDTHTPLAGSSILNISKLRTATADGQGNFEINVTEGDSLSFFQMGYSSRGLRVWNNHDSLSIGLQPLNVQLKEFVLHSELTPYQKDSIARHELYNAELSKQPVKMQYTGLGVNNLFSSIAQHFSYKYKLNKKFKNTFATDEQQRFIDSRYTPQLTHSLTNLSGDSLAQFMNAYAMDYQFARSASDLEIKMWIRNNYKYYLSLYQKDRNIYRKLIK